MLERMWDTVVIAVWIVCMILILRNWQHLNRNYQPTGRAIMVPDSLKNRCPASLCKGLLLVDAYHPANDLHHDRSLFVSELGPETGQQVICNLGHGPWEVRRSRGQVSYYAIST